MLASNERCTWEIRDNTLYCWGFDGFGQLGNGVATDNQPSPVQESTAAIDWTQIDAGSSHSCAVKTDNTLWCWGGDGNGELGNGAAGSQSSPDQESTAATDWSNVSAGTDHSCAVKTGGTLWCWGRDLDGQLGNGGAGNQVSPDQESSAATNWASVSAGEDHSCAVKTNGEIWCWGRSTYGAIGYVAGADQHNPGQEITAATDWAQVSAGFRHSCAVKTGGTLYCWGRSLEGQLGCGACGGGGTPTQESTTATNWASVSAGSFNGGEHSCAVKTDGTLWCWGSDSYGQLGNGATTGTQTSPVQEVTAATDWASVSAGAYHTCAVKTNGMLWCWGYYLYGRLGSVPLPISPIQNIECMNPQRNEGTLFYNSSSKVMQYCDAVGWVGIGNDPCNRPGVAPGTQCGDGTYYAGLSPDGNVPMYMTALASETTDSWNDGNSNYSLTTSTSTTDGDGNTAILLIEDSDVVTGGVQPHNAAVYCDGLSAHGRSDWYLPARNELTLIWNGGTPVGDIKIDGTYYWTSTQGSNISSWTRRFNASFQLSSSKFIPRGVRCVRQQP